MRRYFLIGSLTAVAAGLALQPRAFARFTAGNRFTLSASASVSGGASALTITAAPLPPQAFFGKNVVIPVTVSSDPAPLNTQNLQVLIVYQTIDPSGVAAGIQTAPVDLVRDSKRANTLVGAAIVPRDDLAGIRHGGQFNYFFRARQLGGDTVLAKSGLAHVAPSTSNSTIAAPFSVSLIDTLQAPVVPAGTTVSIPDTYSADGQTTVTFDPGAVSGPGTLLVREEDTQSVPSGPKGTTAVTAYTFELQGTRLVKEAHLTLSYPAETNGKVTGSGADPSNLGAYTLGTLGWGAMPGAQLDTTRHTLSMLTPHFSTYALFAAGALSPKDERTAARIITPNGDGKNDTAPFMNAADEDIHIFDIRGRRIRTLRGPLSVWDGRNDAGGIVESGVYIYQYVSKGTRISGVIYVAK